MRRILAAAVVVALVGTAYEHWSRWRAPRSLPPPGRAQTLEENRERRARRLQWRAELASLSSNGDHRVVPSAAHLIQLDAPGAVIRAVEDVLASVRTGASVRREEDTAEAEPRGSRARPHTLVPPGMTLPHVISPACPGEYCSFSAPRLVCDSVPVYPRSGARQSPTGWLGPGDHPDVDTGLVLVQVPGAVKVTREVRQSGPGQIEVRLSPGDTIFPLYHQGEGFWQVWQDGGQRTVDIFWPWEYWRTPADYEFSGEVIQEVVNEFWTSVSTEEGVEGWVSAGWSDVIIPVGQIPPYECPVGSS